MFYDLSTLFITLLLLQYVTTQVCMAPTTTTTVATTTTTPTCPTGWRTFGSNCYLMVRSFVTAAVANQRCLAMGAHLVSIHSAAEYNFILGMMASTGSGDIWTALVRIGTGTADFANVDSTPYNYANWAPGQPSGAGPMFPEYCVQVWTSGKMNDVNCDALLAYVCKMPL